jgi:methyltransferase
MVISERAYLLLLALIALERVFELLLSQRNARRALTDGGIELGRSHYRVMVTMHTVFLASCAAESILVAHTISPIVSTAALAAVLFAQALRYAAVATLGERWNTRIIVMPGAAPVTRGLYRWMRHPNYVAVVLEIAALPLIRGGWITAVVFSLANALMLAVRIPAEERALGANYSEAFESVSRFFPHLRGG